MNQSNYPPADSLSLADLEEGLEKSFRHTITEEQIDSFAALSGDYSPLHMSTDFAQDRGFKRRVVHGTYLSALVSRLVGMTLPGREAVLHSTQLNFRKPAYPGHTLEIRGIVTRKLDSLKAIQLKITVSAVGEAEDEVLADGKVQVGFTQSARGKE